MRDTSKDIFVRHNVDLKLTAITHFQVQNEVMLVALNGQTLMHVKLQNLRQTNLKLPIEMHDRISHLHLDYNGLHGMVSTVAGENYYVNMRNGNLRPLKRMKGLIVSSVAWNTEYSKDSETGFILVGTTKGSIHETNITSSGTISYFHQLSANITEKELSISGLYFRQVAETEADYLTLVCTPNRLYCLVGPANLNVAQQSVPQQVVGTVWSMVESQSQQESVLQALFSFKAGKKPRFMSMSQDKENEIPPSALAVHPIHYLDESQPPRFAWLTADGLAVGQIKTGIANGKARKDYPDGYELLNVDININHRRSEGRLDYPLDICLTEYHLLLLYTSRIVAISLHDRTLAFEDFYTGVPKIVGMGRDASSQLLWVFSSSTVFKYRPSDECRHVWRIFLDQKEFAKAKKIANQLQDKRPFQEIIKKEAEKFIDDKNYVAAAESLAQSNEPFEKLVLLMLKDGPESRNGLKRFLELRLNQVQGYEQRMDRDMLVLWLLEIQLAELAELRQNVSTNEQPKGAATTSSTSTTTADEIQQQTEIEQQKEAEIRRLKEQLFCFLNRQIVFEAVSDNQAAVYRMVSTHVDFDVQLYLAQKLRDFKTVIKILLMKRAYKEVLDILAKESRPELYYENAIELMMEVPEELVQMLTKQQQEKGGSTLNPLKLLPAFNKCMDPEQRNRAKIVDSTFTYIERFPLFIAPPPLIDFSIDLYATFRPRELLSHLKKCIGSIKSSPGSPITAFDVGHAVRVCREHGLSECLVFLYCVEGLYEDAVKLALTISVELAKQCAHELEEAIERREQESLADFVLDERKGGFDLKVEGRTHTMMAEMRKRVWLEIAKNMIQNGAQISQCLTLIEQSKGSIGIQDLLGYFPEFTKIEHFKEPLLNCLKEYSSEIKVLQREIQDATEMAEELRTEIDKSRSGFMVLRAGVQCTLCRDQLLQRPFVAFICRHFFHRDCLEQKVKEHTEEYANLEAEERLLKKELQLAIAETGEKSAKAKGRWRNGQKRMPPIAAGSSREEMAMKRLESIRGRMRELLCDDCPLCGMRTIEEVDKPFFSSPSEYLEQLKLWMP